MILEATEIKMVGFILKKSHKITSSTTLIAPCSIIYNAGSVTLLDYSLMYSC